MNIQTRNCLLGLCRLRVLASLVSHNFEKFSALPRMTFIMKLKRKGRWTWIISTDHLAQLEQLKTNKNNHINLLISKKKLNNLHLKLTSQRAKTWTFKYYSNMKLTQTQSNETASIWLSYRRRMIEILWALLMKSNKLWVQMSELPQVSK